MQYSTLFGQIAKRIGLVILIPSLFLSALLFYNLRKVSRTRVRQELLDQTRTARSELLANPKLASLDKDGDYIGFCRMIEGRTGARVIIAAVDRRIIGDSRFGAYDVSKQKNRQEISMALDGVAGTSIRNDKVTGQEYLTAVLPIRVDGRLQGSINLIVRWNDVSGLVQELITSLLLPLVVLTMLAFGAAYLVTEYFGKSLQGMAMEVAVLAGKRYPEEHFQDDPLQQLSSELTDMRRHVQDQMRIVERDRKQWELLFARMRLGFLLVNDQLDIVAVNDTAVRLLTFSSDKDLPGTSLLSVTRNADLNSFCRQLVGAADIFQEVELQRQLGDGTIHTLQLSGTQFSQYEFKGAVMMVSDVTHVRQLESGRREFVANVSHELKTPLASIFGYLETLDMCVDEDPEMARKFLDTIKRNTERMHNIIDDLLTLSKLEQNDVLAERDFECRDICESVRTAVKLHEQRIATEHVVIKYELTPCMVKANHRLLEQAVSNLVDNAIKYSSGTPEITVFVEPNVEDVVISVQDNGIGIPIESHEAIFERFYRVDPSRDRQTGGTGLGLSIVKHIIRMHNGTVQAGSPPHGGTVISLRIPRDV